jgi:hypothetical protein
MRLRYFLYPLMMILLISSPCLGDEEAPFSVYVESLERGKVLVEFPVRQGDRFSLDYVHSSDKTPVQDIFEISREGEMILIEENFSWHGSGLEFMSRDGASITFQEGKIRVRLSRPFPSLLLRVGRIANHALSFPGRVVPLNEIARGGERLRIWVAPRDPS